MRAHSLLAAAADSAEPAAATALIEDPLGLTAVLLSVLAILFTLHGHPRFGRLFRVIPLLVFAYFVPTALSNTGVIPYQSVVYTFVKKELLPASLLLLVLAIDVPAILRLGRHAIILLLTATAGIVIGGPLAYLLLGWMVPESLGDQAWKGLAALSGSWIGGGANFIALGENFGASASTISMMVIVDVAIANVWMAVLLYFAGREEKMDARIGADRGALEEVRHRVEAFQKKVARPTSLPDLLAILALGFGGSALAIVAGDLLPETQYIKAFTWTVLIVTFLGLVFSFTPLRRLEGAGASQVGAVFLYLLVATIGAHADFRKIVEVPSLVAVGALWMAIHAATILLARRFLKAPIFFAAVGSQANVGGAASAPVVASAFHPALASVGSLLAVAGYFLGTYAGLACGYLLEGVHALIH